MILVRLLATFAALILLGMCAALLVCAVAAATDGQWWMPLALAPWWGVGSMIALGLLVTVWTEPCRSSPR